PPPPPPPPPPPARRPAPAGVGGRPAAPGLPPAPKAPMVQRNSGGRTLPHPNPLPRGEGTEGMGSLS
ncbi:MAG: RNA polymerase sigma factor SigF, partial [Chloroflexi bacterium]|nr:RNA polymerase sigma factor SigF [Chloroflexota bacterium]